MLRREMSRWLEDGEVLMGQGSGEAVPASPRMRVFPPASPRPAWALSKRKAPLSPQEEVMGKAKELFELCDKEGKGFITKRDMQRLQGEVPLSPEQLETVFESLDRDNNGFLTPAEFNTGLGELVGLPQTVDDSEPEEEDPTEHMDWSHDAAALRFVNILTELGADKLFKSHQELCRLWCELEKDSSVLLSLLEQVLSQAVSTLQDSIRERDSLEHALRRREVEHDQIVRSIYEEMENQVREEREKHLAEDSIKLRQRGQKLEEALKIREQELDVTLGKQKEMEGRLWQLGCEQARIKEQNQQLHSLNVQLQEQLESSREQLQTSLSQLSLLQETAVQEQQAKQRNVLKVSRNMQKEKDSLMRQLELLRDMNKRLRDEKDARLQTQRRPPNESRSLQKKGSIIGNYLQPDKTLKRPSCELDRDQPAKVANTPNRLHDKRRDSTTEDRGVCPQSVFKVIFLGNSGVGKSSFIQHFCTGHFAKKTATVGVDFQMKTLNLKSCPVTLQLWDTAGQERFRSVTEQYYRKADGILAMYDVTDPLSFTAVRAWISSIKEKMCEGTVLMLLGNKLDLLNEESSKVRAAEGQRLAQHHNALFYQCSAKTGYNMDESMNHMAELLISQNARQKEDALLLTKDTPKNRCCT